MMTPRADCMYFLKNAQLATPIYFYFNQLEDTNQNSLSNTLFTVTINLRKIITFE